jgi:hypothetical protein
MKIILFSLTLMAAASLLCFCKHQPKFTAENLPPQQLHWGTGGGVVGREVTYTLLNNGQIFKRSFTGTTIEELPKTKAKTAEAIFKVAGALDFSKFAMDHPGNVYAYLERQDGDAVRRTVWGDPKFPVDADLKAVYDQLNGLLKK